MIFYTILTVDNDFPGLESLIIGRPHHIDTSLYCGRHTIVEVYSAIAVVITAQDILLKKIFIDLDNH